MREDDGHKDERRASHRARCAAMRASCARARARVLCVVVVVEAETSREDRGDIFSSA